jgi:hypothetical protein
MTENHLDSRHRFIGRAAGLGFATNLISNPESKDTIRELNKRLFDQTERTEGMNIPLFRDTGNQNKKRNASKGRAMGFPDELKLKKP